jgi:hypothetical protein
MALLSIVDTSNIVRLQKYVKAATLVPGDSAAISARNLNSLAAAIRAFAEAGAKPEAAEQATSLLKAFEGTRWEKGVERRVTDMLKQWRFEKAIG